MRVSLASRSARTRGYTLIELMVVIIILGMVATLVLVSWESIVPNQRLNSDVRALAAHLHGTRNDAIARSATFQVVYDLEGERYWIETPFRAEGGGFAAADEERLVVEVTELGDGVTFESVTLNGETFENGLVYVAFDARGSSCHHLVVLRQEMFDRYFTIEVIGLTGLIKFHDGVWEREPVEEGDFD